MRLFGRGSVSDFLGDFIVYRNLQPMDLRLPPFDDLCAEAGLAAEGGVPRKSDPGYARLVARLLGHAHRLTAPQARLERLIFVGDTRLSDGTAFANLCEAGEWPGLAFIGSETSGPPAVETAALNSQSTLYLSNRWAALADFDRSCESQGFGIDEATVVVIDLDKTAIGARGRNAQVIDAARVQAVETTVAGIMGRSFDPAAFSSVYDQLNQPQYHAFTADNQDYLAYICLTVNSGLISLTDLLDQIHSERLKSFFSYIAQVEDRLQADPGALPPQLAHIHHQIYTNVRIGDPTPFKAFRRNEYLATVSRMGYLEDETPVEVLLREEIVVTQEVLAQALEWKSRGALLFGLSDKPDEASLPDEDQARQGLQPIHRTQTHIVGE